MHTSTLNHRTEIRLWKWSRILCTTSGKHVRVHTYTNKHTQTNHYGHDWFHGFIGASQSHEAGREEGAATHFQERRHLLQLNHDWFPRRWEDTDYVILSFTCFTSTKAQILAPAEGSVPLYLLYEYKITDTDTWRTLNTIVFILLDIQT